MLPGIPISWPSDESVPLQTASARQPAPEGLPALIGASPAALRPMAALGANILVVDDEPDISALVTYHLARETYRVRTAATGPEAIQSVEVERPDLMVLDLMLPGMDGMEVLERLRAREETADLPVILLTARTEERYRIEGLRLGADDYISKPFSPQELVLRVGAVLRRVRQAPPAGRSGRTLRAGPFVVDCDAASAALNGQPLELTATEFHLLMTLMERRGRVQSRRQLLEAVWGVTQALATRTVDMHVQRLRNKLGAEAEWIETVRGFGYRFRPESVLRNGAGG
jgi:two-component system, OmpR family, phosphate regulon response regulator PhoB